MPDSCAECARLEEDLERARDVIAEWEAEVRRLHVRIKELERHTAGQTTTEG